MFINSYTTSYLVDERFALAEKLAKQAEQEVFRLINALISLSNGASQINVDAAVPLNLPSVPVEAPFSDMLVKGSTGIPDDSEALIWERCKVRAGTILVDAVDRVQKQFSGFSALPTATLGALMAAEIDKGSWYLLDIGRKRQQKEFEVAAEFAKILAEHISRWTLANYESDKNLAIMEAKLRLERAMMDITDFMERERVEITGYAGAGDTAAHLAAAVMQSVSVSASIGSSTNQNQSAEQSSTRRSEERNINETSSTNSSSTTETQIDGNG